MDETHPGAMSTIVARSIQNTALLPQDAAIRALALYYALMIDNATGDEQAKALATFGPKLQSALAQMEMTPASRKTLRGGQPSEPVQPAASPIEQLQAEYGRHFQLGS